MDHYLVVKKADEKDVQMEILLVAWKVLCLVVQKVEVMVLLMVV
jgi:hypothetical protein